jgi:hypothetical protein
LTPDQKKFIALNRAVGLMVGFIEAILHGWDVEPDLKNRAQTILKEVHDILDGKK